MNLNDLVWFRLAKGAEHLSANPVMTRLPNGYFQLQLWQFCRELRNANIGDCIVEGELLTSYPPVRPCESDGPTCKPVAPAFLVHRCSRHA